LIDRTIDRSICHHFHCHFIPTHQVRRLEQFCRTVDGWLQERIALNQQLERSLADCVCSTKFA
jgi:hypothetical protein